ncbi:MAG TPA: killer suppression protein HigA [Bacteroidales bacterium]|nr:killer suppression protein HigA [Bacteroidales bacterium]
MRITFADKRLEKIANDDSKMLKAFGRPRASILKRRLTQLLDATTLEEVRYLPGHYHELIHDRKGQWSCDLDQPYRLIFTPHQNPIPTDADGRYIWTEISGVEIIEIVDYH